MKTTTRFLALAAALALSGCATSYQLTVMPRDSGKLYSGTAESGSGSEGTMSITIEGKTYNGTWVSSSPSQTTGFTTGFGWGGRHGGAGAMVTMDNPQGGEAKALLTSSDGSGLRCDLRSGDFSRGGGVCRDDRGREYDVQIRPAPRG
jgi:hypothetical protein